MVGKGDLFCCVCEGLWMLIIMLSCWVQSKRAPEIAALAVFHVYIDGTTSNANIYTPTNAHHANELRGC